MRKQGVKSSPATVLSHALITFLIAQRHCAPTPRTAGAGVDPISIRYSFRVMSLKARKTTPSAPQIHLHSVVPLLEET